METAPNDIPVPTEIIPPDSWMTIGAGGALHRRFEFENYAAVSAFLELLAKLSKDAGLYPDLSFAKTHVNVTIPSGEGQSAVTQREFADRSNQIFDAKSS